MEYTRDIRRYQENLRAHKYSADRLSVQMKNVYLNPLLPALHKRSSSMLRDVAIQQSQEIINQNVQNSLVENEHRRKKSFFRGLYKNQPSECQFKNMKISQLIRDLSPPKKQLAAVLPPVTNEIRLSNYFVKKSNKKLVELNYTNRWESEKGTRMISLDNLDAISLSEQIVKVLGSHELIRCQFIDYSMLLLKSKLITLLSGVFYDQLIDFDEMYQYFSGLKFTYLEVFFLKYALQEVLIQNGYGFQQVMYALQQFEEYRYLMVKPIQFMVKLFDTQFYSLIVKQLAIKLLKSPSYLKFMQANKIDNSVLVQTIRQCLFPFLMGDYVGVLYHVHENDQHELYRNQGLTPLINGIFLQHLRSVIQQDELYSHDVETRLTMERSIIIEAQTFMEYYVKCWALKKCWVPSCDIKALIRIHSLHPGETILDGNITYLSQFENLRLQQLFN